MSWNWIPFLMEESLMSKAKVNKEDNLWNGDDTNIVLVLLKNSTTTTNVSFILALRRKWNCQNYRNMHGIYYLFISNSIVSETFAISDFTVFLECSLVRCFFIVSTLTRVQFFVFPLSLFSLDICIATNCQYFTWHREGIETNVHFCVLKSL